MLWRAKRLVSNWVCSLELEPFQWGRVSSPACGEAGTFDPIWKPSVLPHESRYAKAWCPLGNSYDLNFVPLPRLRETHRIIRSLGGYRLAFRPEVSVWPLVWFVKRLRSLVPHQWAPCSSEDVNLG